MDANVYLLNYNSARNFFKLIFINNIDINSDKNISLNFIDV